MANALNQAWMTGQQDVSLGNHSRQNMNYTTQDPYGDYRRQLAPLLMGQYQSALMNRNRMPGGMGIGAAISRVGGHAQLGPGIDAGPIWDAGAIQARVNQGRASTDAQRDVNIQRQQQQLAQRGYSTNSPLAMQNEQQQRGLAMMGNARAENDMRWAAALGNAQHQQQGQMANAQNWRGYQDEDIRRRQLGLSAWSTDQNRRMAQWQQSQQDPQSMFSQLMALLQGTRPEQQLLNQSQDTNPFLAVDHRSLA